MKTLPRWFYDRDAKSVAKDLIGKTLFRKIGGQEFYTRIIETEAYLGTEDKACHASKGKTNRNSVMFGPPGFIYIYFIYGMYDMLNIVTAEEGNPHAVLIRALEPLTAGVPIKNKLNGPGKLTRELKITQEFNQRDLLKSLDLKVLEGRPPLKISAKPRIGVDYAGKWAHKKLRFYEKDNDMVSRL